jgi:hypothetical protein
MKPIAYIDHVSGKPKLIDGYVVQTDYDIPLYTTPPTRQLSDEEINKVFLKYWGGGDASNDEIGFARAIEAKLKGQ